jgi:hypothetical protein
MATSETPVTGLRDELLDKFVGSWRITRVFSTRTVENDAVVTWELEHRYLRIAMIDVVSPPAYAAHVYIGYERDPGRYVVHWMDTTSGSSPALLGFGVREGDSLVLEWKDDDAVLRNTFAWHADDGTWTSNIVQTGADGVWRTFCVDTYRRVE